ncbi:MAG: hypothetical protein AVDCRST_MAG26-3684, partial [uncultured Chloroflexia bacterium]
MRLLRVEVHQAAAAGHARRAHIVSLQLLNNFF